MQGKYRFRTTCKGINRFRTTCKGIYRFRTTCKGIYRFRMACNGVYRFCTTFKRIYRCCTTCKGIYYIDVAHHVKEYTGFAQRPEPQLDKKTTPASPKNPGSGNSANNFFYFLVVPHLDVSCIAAASIRLAIRFVSCAQLCRGLTHILVICAVS